MTESPCTTGVNPPKCGRIRGETDGPESAGNALCPALTPDTAEAGMNDSNARPQAVVPVTAPTIEEAARAGLTPQEWAPGGNRCMKATAGKTGRCHNRARWCDTAAAARYDRYDFTNREPGSYAYKVCNRHAAVMVRGVAGL